VSHEAGEALKNHTPLANQIRFEIARPPVLYNPGPVEIEGNALSWRKPQRKCSEGELWFASRDLISDGDPGAVFLDDGSYHHSRGHDPAGVRALAGNGTCCRSISVRQPDAERLGHHEQDHRKPDTDPDVVGILNPSLTGRGMAGISLSHLYCSDGRLNTSDNSS
jgi:hypothetical protein